MPASKTNHGSCFCGSVHIEVTGAPVAMGYCHCDSCRHWSASPVNAFTLWKPNDVKVTKGAEHIGTFNRTTTSDRKWCKKCGGHVFTNHPAWGVVDVYAATIPNFAFAPGLHVNYQEAKLRIRDGLPKMKDMPAEMGGSGVVIAE